MKARTVIVVIAFILIAGGGLIIFAWNSKPQLMEVYPQAGASGIPTTTMIQLTFSRSMDTRSVRERLVIDPAITGTYTWEGNMLSFSPNQPWPGGREIQVSLEAGARGASWLSFPMDRFVGSFTTSEAALAYLWPSDGSANIYSLDPAYGSIHQYTRGMDVLDYSASNDGLEIYFSTRNAQGGADLYRINRFEADNIQDKAYIPEKLLLCGVAQCRSPEISVDGRYLAYEYLLPTLKGGLGPAQIWILSLPESNAIQISQPSHEAVQPGWSSTGLLAFYDRSSNGYEIVNPNTKEHWLLPNQTGQPGDWSVDGDYYLAPEISYTKSLGNYETGNSHLIRYRVEDDSSMDLSGENSVEDVEAIYSPDGGSIAFTRKYLNIDNWTLGRQVWVMNADGSNAHPITNEADYNHYDLAWSRDGAMLAYVRFNEAQLSDSPELWMVNKDGSNPVQLVIGGYSPIWIP